MDTTEGWTTLIAEPGITATRKDGAAVITFDQPDKLNALSLDATRIFHEIVVDLAGDPSVRAVMLTGRGRAFSAGADLGDAFNEAGLAALPAHMRDVTTPTLLTLRTMPKPVIAAVRGVAAGVGCSFALAADYVVVSESAKFILSFSKIGLSLDGGASALLVARAGFGRAMRMALFAEPICATDALAAGVADEVVPDETFDEVVTARFEALANGPTQSYAASKRLLNASALPQFEEALVQEARTVAELIKTPDFRGAVAAATTGRTPTFTGTPAGR